MNSEHYQAIITEFEMGQKATLGHVLGLELATYGLIPKICAGLK